MNNIIWHNSLVSKQNRFEIKSQKPCILWFSGLSGSGKSTIANALELELNRLKYHTYLLDGDNIRHGLNKDLGFSDDDRVENIRRIGEVCRLFVDSGLIVLSAFISPFQKDRDMVRALVDDDEFIEIFVDTPLEVCKQRDPKGLYKKALNGEIKNFTGIDSVYEEPEKADIHIQTDKISIEDAVDNIVIYLKERKYVR